MERRQCRSITTYTPTATACVGSTNTATDTAGKPRHAGDKRFPGCTGSLNTPTPTRTRRTRLRCWSRQPQDGKAMASRIHIERRDAAQALAAMPAGSISVLVADPPYRTVDRKGNGHLRSWFAHSLTWRKIGEVLALARTKMRPDGVALVMTNPDGLRQAIEAMEKAGFAGVRPITWDKMVPGLGGGLRHQTEFVLVGRLWATRALAGTDLVSVRSVGPGTANRYPTEKPADLGRALAQIANVGPADHVVDPFCGSGALLIGAAERGAKMTGFDVAPAAIERASARLVPPILVRRQPEFGRRRPPARRDAGSFTGGGGVVVLARQTANRPAGTVRCVLAMRRDIGRSQRGWA
jgi:hypothetical protein